MIFQEGILSQGYLTALFAILVVTVIIFILGIIITRWWAIKEDWNDTYKLATRLNLFWLISNLVLFIALIPVVYGILIAALTSFLINIIVGALVTSKLYEKNFKESLILVLFIIIILFIMWFIVYLITIVILAVITVGLQINRT